MLCLHSCITAGQWSINFLLAMYQLVQRAEPDRRFRSISFILSTINKTFCPLPKKIKNKTFCLFSQKIRPIFSQFSTQAGLSYVIRKSPPHSNRADHFLGKSYQAQRLLDEQIACACFGERGSSFQSTLAWCSSSHFQGVWTMHLPIQNHMCMH